MPRRKPGPGRPSKGDRDTMVTRPFRPVGDEIRVRAEALDMTISDYVSMVLAEAHGMPEYAPKPQHGTDQELPLAKSA